MGVTLQFRVLQDNDDKCGQLIWNSTEEGKKVTSNNGSKFSIICEKVTP